MQGQDEVTMKRMKMAFRALGVTMVPLTASMPQVGNLAPCMSALKSLTLEAANSLRIILPNQDA